MADKTLRYVVTAADQGASKTLSGVADHGSKASAAISGAFSKMSGVVGGEVGELSQRLSEAFDSIGEAGGKSLSEKLAIGGTALAGLGGAFTLLGSGEKQATDQLNLAIQNTGKNADSFAEDIEKSVKNMENFGYTAVQTKDALTTLTNGTHDPTKAMQLLGEAADYAAVKHVSLTDASTAIIRVLGGSTRSAREMGVQIVKNADGTTNYAATNEALAKVLHGQASAAADNFGGTLKRLRAEVEDGAAAFGQKYGPMITSAGVGMMALSPILAAAKAGASKIGDAFKTTATESEESAAAIGEADAAIVTENDAAAASGDRMAASSGKMKLAGMGAAVGVAAVTYGAYELGKSINGAIEKNNAFAYSLDHLNANLADFRTTALNSADPTAKVGEQWAQAQLHAEGLDKKAAAAGVTMAELTKAVTGDAASFKDLVEKWKSGGKPSDDTITALGLLAEGYHKTKDEVDKAKASTDSETTSLAKVAQQGQTTTQALTQLKDGFNNLNSSTMDAERANITFKDSLDTLTQSEKTNGHSLSDNTAAGRANRSSILDSISAAQAHSEAVLQQTGSVTRASAAFKSDTSALAAHLVQLGYNKGQVAGIIAEYARMPSMKLTTLDVRNLASQKLDYIQTQLYKATDRNWAVEVDVNENVTSRSTGIGSLSIKMEAAGTDYFSGGSTLIAEREAEVVNLPRGSSVTPLSKMRGGSGGGSPIIVNIATPQVWTGSNMDLARVVVSSLEEWTRQGGKIRGVTN